MDNEQNYNERNWKKNLDDLLKPKTIAVLGATEKVGPGRNTVYNLLHMNFNGTVYPINPQRDTVFGLQCYPSLRVLPEKPALAVISLPAGRVVDALRECGEIGIGAVTVYSSGFAESNEEGLETQRKLTEICEEKEIRLCGPNCLGHLNVTEHTGAWSGSIPREMSAGKVAVVSQSGSMAIAMLQYFKGLGVNHVISCGNQAVLDLSDYFMYLSEDEDTKVITAFIEGIDDGGRFIQAINTCRRRGKVIVALKTGKSEVSKQAVKAHTAAMAGSDEVFEEALSEGGVLKVDDFDEMLQTTTLLLKSPKMASKGVALVTISGGQIGMIADIASATGLDFITFDNSTVEKLKTVIPPYLKIVNPIDVGPVGSDNHEDYAKVLRASSEDPACGLVLVSQDAPAGLGPSTIEHYTKVAHAVSECFKDGVPVVMFSNHSGTACPEILQELFDTGAPYLQGTRESLKAVLQLRRHSFERESQPAPSLIAHSTWASIEEKLEEFSAGAKFLGEKEGKELMSMLGIPVTEPRFCKNEEALRDALSELGFPVVMKIESKEIAHKTDVGGVILNLNSEAEVRKAYAEMIAAMGKNLPKTRIDGVSLQKMAPNGIDLILGTHEDPQFGPVLVYGLGGVYVEVFKDSSLGLIPINREKAREIIEKSKSYPLLKEVRGRPAFDLAPLEDLMLRVSEFAYHFKGRISSIDLNPVRIGASGVCVLDALLILRRE
ncbi:MAG: acetate--CoA ligase family protein [Synergistaceae bacterium]|jgi:acetyltransferase|nr:acetate--CoA ligase family protein [Synergistaceae bacterium]